MSLSARLVAPLLGLVLVVSGVVSPPLATAAPDSDSPASAAPRKGRVAVVIKAPAGVAVTLQLRPKVKPARNARTLTKPARGARVVRRVSLPKGPVTVVAPDLVRGGKLYRASTRTKVTVRPGRTTRLTVSYRLAKNAPRALTPRSITPQRVVLGWKGAGGKAVRLVRTTGTAAATGVKKGRTIKVAGTSATDSGVAGGQSYTYALFTRVGKKWAGPVTTTVGTPSPGKANSTTYLLDPDTRVLARSEIASARYLPRGALIRTSGQTPLVIGQVVGLPVTPSMPRGFLGRVTGIAADGTATATPATLGEAFDRLTLRSRLSPAARPLVPGSNRAPTRPSAQADDNTCLKGGTYEDDADSIEAEVDPVFDITGEFNADMVTTEVLKLPIGAKVDAELTATLGLAFSIDADAEASCTLEFKEFMKNLPTTSPIPILVIFGPHVELATSGRVALDAATVSASATMGFDAELSLKGKTGKGRWNTDLQAFEEPPTFTAGAMASVDFGGSLTIGPGFGSADGGAGATAGVKGTLNPLSLSASATLAAPVDDLEPVGCLSLAAGGNAKLGLTARAWLGQLPEWEDGFDVPGLSTEWDYKRVSFPVECAGAKSDMLVIHDQEGTHPLVDLLESFGYSVAETNTWWPEMVSPIDLTDYKQVWYVADTSTGSMGQAMHDYVKNGGSLMLSGDPMGPPLRVPAGNVEREVDVSDHAGLLDSLLKTPRVTPGWLAHQECTICWKTVTLPLENGTPGDITESPHLSPEVTAAWDYFYRDVPARNTLIRTGRTNQALSTIWAPADLVGGEGLLVTMATSSWHDPELIGHNKEFAENAAHYLTGVWQRE